MNISVAVVCSIQMDLFINRRTKTNHCDSCCSQPGAADVSEKHGAQREQYTAVINV